MELKKLIAEWIKAARTEAGLSGDELGMRLAFELGAERGNSKANISHWETMKHSPNLEQLLAIVKVTRKGLPVQLISSMQIGEGNAQSIHAHDAPTPDTTVEPIAELPVEMRHRAPNPAMQLIYDHEYYLLDLYRRADERGKEDIISIAQKCTKAPLAAPALVRGDKS